MHLEGRLADRDSWTADRCSVDRALSVIGTRTAMLVLREAAYGAHRFDEFARRVGVTDAVMAARLRQLTDDGLLRREPYREPGQRTRFEYHLTDMGRDVLPALLALMQWGDRYLTGEDGPPLRVTHMDCGAPVTAKVTCARGHEVPSDEISVRRSPRRVTPDATP
ncbi:transcriptional regulator family protein [Virgisporangium aliadipatigenens]|uniref:Transcriptional regulator family protein n=1 Tax=Virgisporangium aliadipatigenens TaxID=741659 RepID=A0A8J4DXU4_9ACTN|nr:helix-turn-helix domain-containing protein [Virgisporangium aliadipatigenens]GIJ52422.1 transcriptional regulator family protein [Virgisporangium aliadipatigenens]